ncbi:MAG: cytochrome d ubiquinol oxidase subunit II [Myxococcota bacterium]
MLALVLLFLAVSLLLYVLLAGADFGAGILEIFLGQRRRDDQRALISHAMAPVWEANHVWLILAVVILFMAFPTVYTTLSIYLYIPLVALLMGIVARGTAFTFRHYDTLTTEWHGVYSRVFQVSSLWTSMVLGALAGALVLGRIELDSANTYTTYVAPWLNLFCLAMGVFTSALFALLAAVFLVGEAEDDELRALFQHKARVAALVLVAAGAAVFGTAQLNGLPLLRSFFGTPASVGAFVLATALLPPFWRALSHADGGRTRARILGASIVTLVMLGWFAVQYPVALRLAHGAITFPEAAAPDATLRALLGALFVGSALIFPGLGYLFWVFKRGTFERERHEF